MSAHGLENHGFRNLKAVNWNLTVPALYEEAMKQSTEYVEPCCVFGTACTPETPIGTCMVSSEGACAAYYNFGRFSRERVRAGGTTMLADPVVVRR